MSSAPLLVTNTQDSATHPFGVPFYCCLIWKTSGKCNFTPLLWAGARFVLILLFFSVHLFPLVP